MNVDTFISMLAFWEKFAFLSRMEVRTFIIAVSAVGEMPALNLLLFISCWIGLLYNTNVVLVRAQIDHFISKLLYFNFFLSLRISFAYCLAIWLLNPFVDVGLVLLLWNHNFSFLTLETFLSNDTLQVHVEIRSVLISFT